MSGAQVLRVLADDLSGAAECAAVLARAASAPAPLLLGEPWPAEGSFVVDTDARALPDAHAAAAASLRALHHLQAPGVQVFKKIDSTLRGHIAAELQAALAAPGLLDAVLVCPALPEQGRSLAGGVLHVRGVPQHDASGRPVDLCRMLRDAGLQPALFDAHGRQGGALADALGSALAAGTRLLVVDASDDADLRRTAAALRRLATRRVLAAGAAGLARAVAAELLQAREAGRPPLPSPAMPVLTLVGSYSSVSTGQLAALAQDARNAVFRVPADAWQHRRPEATRALAQAREQLAGGGNVAFANTSAPVGPGRRALVEAIAAELLPLLPLAGTLVLTGGDTARAVLDRLGVRRLDVLGEFEPGICISRAADRDASPLFVTKAGGFGDPESLLRVVRHFSQSP